MNDSTEAFVAYCELCKHVHIAIINKGCELLKDDPKQCRQFLAQMDAELKVTLKELTKIMLGKV